MRYDDGYGRHGGWETRMPDGGRGFDRGYPDPPRGGGDAGERPWVGGYREGYQGGSGGYALGTSGPLYESYGGAPEREHGHRRPRGQQGGGRQGTYFVRARANGGYGGDYGARGSAGDRWAYEDEAGGTGFGASNARPGFGELGHLQGGGYDRGMRGRSRYGRDFGGRSGGRGYDRGMTGGGRGGYDLPFRNEGRPEDYHPRYSPVGGTYAPMGGWYAAGHTPRPLQDPRWTSEWTRWF